jgi:hypothetical protein
MAYVSLPLTPGVYKDETPLSAKGFFTDAQWVRPNRGKMEVMGGYELATNDSVNGICRGLHAWRDNLAQSYEAIGTNTYLQVYYDGEIYDITPLDTWGSLTNPFDTTDASTSVNVSHTAHGRSVGDRVIFSDASAVGGLTINGEYTVTTVVGVDDYTITASSAATSTAGPGGGTVNYEYLLPIGLVDNLGGPGYGVGGFGTGGYGQGASETTYYPRVWTLDNWGQNLIACPRGGMIYEWSPAFSNSEVVTNGTFASDTAWTKGTGWSIGSGVATATAGSASSLSQSLTLVAGAYYVLEYDITVSAGTLQVSLGGVDIGDVISASTSIKIIVYNYGASLSFDKDSSFAGTIDNITMLQSLRAAPIPNAPTENTLIWVTDQRILVAAGTIDASTSAFDPLHIRWSDQEDNQDWTPTAANQSGSFTFGKGGRIVTGVSGRGQNVVWVDKGLYTMRYVPDPNVVYAFDFVGTGCGPVGTHAAVMLAGVNYWMANTGEFFRFSGGAPEPLFCPVRKYIFDRLALSQDEKVYAFGNSAFKEVGWLYPGDSNECDSYVIYNVAENAWSIGTIDRTAWLDSGGLDFVTAVSANSELFFMEKGNSADGNPLEWSMTTGALDIAEGNFLSRIMGVIPDFDDFLGGCTITVSGKVYPNSTATSTSVNVTNATDYKSLRVTGRQIQVTFAGNAAPAFMRTGEIRMDLVNTEQMR